ncbi:octopamine receptor 1-like [Gigantopelta aegis]|uniref:octopamine receptor 1-like n=1 Tax=Gigantopelta aegis TaxID=1735272 RepID=UPI001B88BB81|nr:octopamine receptor 1-like [Gigantopelta aegis]XP_041370869.1 octopamine receptor 1-like [Gigantopelta aegis]
MMSELTQTLVQVNNPTEIYTNDIRSDAENVTRKCVNVTSTLAYAPVDAEFVIASVVLAVINMAVLFGNSLVVAAVFKTRKLRTVTNIFIVNLACADLLLGILVLPFSATLEVLDVWVFGVIWCRVWLAVDVWLCTASIFNLCCISLDRYLAITRPMKYPALMSSKRGKILVLLIWVISFIICFPPLIGWNEDSPADEDVSPQGDDDNSSSWYADFNVVGNDSFYSNTQFTIFQTVSNQLDPSCVEEHFICELTNARGYRIYASLGSFYLPMLVLIFFYIQIYRAAAKTISGYEKGVLTSKANGTSDKTSLNRAVTLRVHRGGGASTSTFTKPSVPQSLSSEMAMTYCNEQTSLKRESSFRGTVPKTTVNSSGTPPKFQKRFRSKSNTLEVFDGHAGTANNGCAGLSYQRSCTRDHRNRSADGKGANSALGHRKNLTTLQRQGRNIKAHMKKFHREKKAAKTLAIIVGAFILCWMPFFTIYVIDAFCDRCIHPQVFSVFFWLGYCNSAINPCVYALFSRDFRFAFKKLLTWKQLRRKMTKSLSENISMHQMRSTHHNSEDMSES